MNMALMGLVNVKPDSFVGDVRSPTVGSAVARCLRVVVDGVSIIDIDGEST